MWREVEEGEGLLRLVKEGERRWKEVVEGGAR